MKKRLIAITCLVIGTLFAASCKKGQQTPTDNAGDVSSDSAVKLQYNCEVNAEDFPTEVTLYEAEYWKSTDYGLEADLLKGEIVDHKVWAEGPQTIANYQGNDEYLYFHDGGEACFGEKGSAGKDGGLTYVNVADTEKWDMERSARSLKWDLFGVMSGAPAEVQNIDLWGEEDLPFRPLKDVEEDLLQQFRAWDLEMETLEKYTVNISSEENYYLLMFTELIDDIPLMPYFYSEGFTQYNDWLAPCDVYVYVAEDGIADMELDAVVKPTQDLEKVKIISLKDAQASLETQVRAKYTEDVTVEDMGLYYIGMPETQKNTFKLTPFWMFCVSTEVEVPTVEGGKETVTEVFYEVLNAVDGEWLQH